MKLIKIKIKHYHSFINRKNIPFWIQKKRSRILPSSKISSLANQLMRARMLKLPQKTNKTIKIWNRKGNKWLEPNHSKSNQTRKKPPYLRQKKTQLKIESLKVSLKKMAPKLQEQRAWLTSCLRRIGDLR